jgi:hypothetical protein
MVKTQQQTGTASRSTHNGRTGFQAEKNILYNKQHVLSVSLCYSPILCASTWRSICRKIVSNNKIRTFISFIGQVFEFSIFTTDDSDELMTDVSLTNDWLEIFDFSVPYI